MLSIESPKWSAISGRFSTTGWIIPNSFWRSAFLAQPGKGNSRILRANRTRDDMTILLLGPSALTHSPGLFSKSSILMFVSLGRLYCAPRFFQLRLKLANLVANLRRVLILFLAHRLLQLFRELPDLPAQHQRVHPLRRHLAEVMITLVHRLQERCQSDFEGFPARAADQPPGLLEVRLGEIANRTLDTRRFEFDVSAEPHQQIFIKARRRFHALFPGAGLAQIRLQQLPSHNLGQVNCCVSFFANVANHRVTSPQSTFPRNASTYESPPSISRSADPADPNQ